MDRKRKTTVHAHSRKHPTKPGKKVPVKEHSRTLQILTKTAQRSQQGPKGTVGGRGTVGDFLFETGYTRPGEGDLGEWKSGTDLIERLNAEAKKEGREPVFEKISGTMYFAQDGGNTGQSRVIWRSGKRAKYFDVQTDKFGRVTLDLAAERLMDIADGDRDGRWRNPIVDFLTTANVRTASSSKKKEDRGRMYKWWRHPNESDVKGLDVAESDLHAILPKSKNKKRKRHIIISGGTDNQRKAVMGAIENAFTIKEKKLLAGTLIKIAPTRKPNVAGYYYQRRDPRTQEFIGAPLIVIEPRYANEEDLVAVHECIHNLREHDHSRKGALKATKTYKGKDKDLEESMTEAETRSRQKPFQPGRGAGYYQYVKDRKGKTDGELELEDRIIINNIDLKKHKVEMRNKRGKRAISATRKKFPKTNLARVSIEGETEAINSYYTAERDDGIQVNIHTHQPQGGKAADKKEQAQLKKEFREVHEWRDGKKVKVR